MKNTAYAYENRLRNYLIRYNFPEAEDENFIIARAEQAYDVFCDARLRGLDVLTSEELAKITLMQGLDITFDDVVKEILTEEFADDVPEYEHDILIADMGDLLDEYRELYDITPEFIESPEGYDMKTMLIGIIEEYIDNNGL